MILISRAQALNGTCPAVVSVDWYLQLLLRVILATWSLVCSRVSPSPRVTILRSIYTRRDFMVPFCLSGKYKCFCVNSQVCATGGKDALWFLVVMTKVGGSRWECVPGVPGLGSLPVALESLSPRKPAGVHHLQCLLVLMGGIWMPNIVTEVNKKGKVWMDILFN